MQLGKEGSLFPVMLSSSGHVLAAACKPAVDAVLVVQCDL